jgi:hypothetical protein
MIRARQRALLAGLLALAAAGVVVVAAQPRASRMASDFTVDYSAGRLLREGQFAAPYQQARLAVTMREVAPESGIDPRLPFNMPLAAALPYAVLGLLPLELAFRIWQAALLIVLWLALASLARTFPLGRGALLLGMLGMLAAVPVWATLSEGQPSPLLLLGAALMLSSLGSKSLWQAALAGSLLAVKPQYFPVYLTVVLAVRGWRLMIAACLGASLVLMSPLMGGPSALISMVHNALLANQAVDARLDESVIGLLAGLLPPVLATSVALSLYAANLLALCLTAWRRRLDLPSFALLAGMLAVLASPHALPHDLVILAVPAWLTFALMRQQRVHAPALAWMAADLALVVDLRGPGIRLLPLVLIGLLAWMILEIRQRAEPREHRMADRLAS